MISQADLGLQTGTFSNLHEAHGTYLDQVISGQAAIKIRDFCISPARRKIPDY